VVNHTRHVLTSIMKEQDQLFYGVLKDKINYCWSG
jgi:hypothetical protein